MDKFTRAMYAKARDGGCGFQLETPYPKTKYLDKDQELQHPCHLCRYYAGDEKCEKRGETREISDYDFDNCRFWRLPRTKQDPVQKSRKKSGANRSNKKVNASPGKRAKAKK